jgi:hypothetical protein
MPELVVVFLVAAIAVSRVIDVNHSTFCYGDRRWVDGGSGSDKSCLFNDDYDVANVFRGVDSYHAVLVLVMDVAKSRHHDRSFC